MQGDLIIGQIQAVHDRKIGSQLIANVSSGASTIQVENPWQFNLDDGQLQIGSDIYTFTVPEYLALVAPQADLSVPAPVAGEEDPINDEFSYAGVLNISPNAVNAYSAEDPVYLYPNVTERWALVKQDDTGEPLHARVAYGLYPLIPEGVRTENQGEVVVMEHNGQDLVVVDLYGAPPTMDGGFITPGTVPQAGDGSPPSSSPSATVTPGPAFLAVTWTPVANFDTVNYEVHLSTTTGFTPSSSTLVGVVPNGSGFVIDATPTGAALTIGTTYYVRIVARDIDGAAAAGVQGSGAPLTLNAGTYITAGTITGGLIAANTIDATKLNVSQLSAITANMGTLTAGEFKTASGVSWAGSAAGIIISSIGDGSGNYGMRAFDGVAGTYELVGGTGKVVVGALASDTTKQRIEITRSGMAMYEQTAGNLITPPTTGGGSAAALAWATLYIPAIGVSSALITNVTNSTSPTITTATAHGYTTGDTIEIRGVQTTGGTAPNGYYTATVVTSTTFTIGTVPATGTYIAATGGTWKVTAKGQFTTSTDTSGSRMWFDYQGLHSQYQISSLDQGMPFRTFDFNPGDANGLRLHTATTLDAMRVSPTNGVTFKLAATDDPNQDLGARWVRQTGGALAVKMWGDNLGDDTQHGQANFYAYAVSPGGVGQCVIQAQVGTGTSPVTYATLLPSANFAGASSVQAKAGQSGAGSASVIIIKHDGTSSFAQLATTGTFTIRQNFYPSTDSAAMVVRAGSATPTQPIVQFQNFGGTALASIRPFGRGSFTSDGITTLVNSGAITDALFGETPASGTIAVDTSDGPAPGRLYVRIGTAWKYVGVGTTPAGSWSLPAYSGNRAPAAPGTISQSEIARALFSLIDDLKTAGVLQNYP